MIDRLDWSTWLIHWSTIKVFKKIKMIHLKGEGVWVACFEIWTTECLEGTVMGKLGKSKNGGAVCGGAGEEWG